MCTRGQRHDVRSTHWPYRHVGVQWWASELSTNKTPEGATWSHDLPSKLGENTLKRCPLPGVFCYFLYKPWVTSWTNVLLERGNTKAQSHRNWRKFHDKLNYMNQIFLNNDFKEMRITETEIISSMAILPYVWVVVGNSELHTTSFQFVRPILWMQLKRQSRSASHTPGLQLNPHTNRDFSSPSVTLKTRWTPVKESKCQTTMVFCP